MVDLINNYFYLYPLQGGLETVNFFRTCLIVDVCLKNVNDDIIA